MPVNFDDAIPFFDDCVAAIGPEHPKEEIREICVWIYQPLEDGTGEVGATEMTTHRAEGEHPHFVRIGGAGDKPGRWLLPVMKVGNPDLKFRKGRASAVAIALVVENVNGAERQRVAWWNQQVELHEDEARVREAIAAVHDAAIGRESVGNVLKEGPLATPITFEGI